MERPQTGQDAPSEPPTVSPLGRITGCVNLHVGEIPAQLGGQTVAEPGEEGAAAGEDDVGHEDLAELGVAGAE